MTGLPHRAMQAALLVPPLVSPVAVLFLVLGGSFFLVGGGSLAMAPVAVMLNLRADALAAAYHGKPTWETQDW